MRDARRRRAYRSALATDCFAFLTLQELLRFVQPALLCAIFVRRRSFHRVDASLHGTRGFLLVAKARVRAAHQVKTLRIVLATLQELLQSVARVCELASRNVRRADFAPDFVK